MTKLTLLAAALAFSLAGCAASYGPVGAALRPSPDAAAILKSGRPYDVLGPAEGKACRYMLGGVYPWGDSNFTAAVDAALAQKGADALINISEMNDIRGYYTYLNIFSYSCTRVKGLAVKFK